MSINYYIKIYYMIKFGDIIKLAYKFVKKADLNYLSESKDIIFSSCNLTEIAFKKGPYCQFHGIRFFS